MADICILGAGAFGAALSVLLNKNSHNIKVWERNRETAEKINTTRLHHRLEGIHIADEILYTSDLKEALSGAEYILIAIPSAFIRENLKKLKAYYRGQTVINVSKGIEEGSLSFISEQVREELGSENFAVMSGPSHAIELTKGLATSCVVASKDKETAQKVRDLFMNSFFRLYTTDDVLAVELGGASKNVIALAAGIADGLGYGDNAKAALITRGIAEISRLGVAMGGKSETFFGLSGIGDLIVTCASMHSRNRRAGIMIGKGYDLESAQKEIGMVVEGVYSAKATKALAEKYKVEMPIINQVVEVLFDNKDPRLAVEELMGRDKNVEFYRSGYDSYKN
jgi:glycerol-3-phosphate dehydrogenase [NAD(P)+]